MKRSIRSHQKEPRLPRQPYKMQEDSFEKRLIMQDVHDRQMARIKYTLGIQGTDGGRSYC